MKKLSEKQKQKALRLQRRRWRRRYGVEVVRHRRAKARRRLLADRRLDGAELPDGSVVVKAPRRLENLDEGGELLAFLDRIRDRALNAKGGAFIDLRDCEYIGVIACLLLAAEVERCNGLRPRSINGCDPRASVPRGFLHAFGFHKRLGLNLEQGGTKGILEIRSGNETAGAAARLEEVVSIAAEAFGDRAFANRVHGVLNEALLNVSMHAYDPDFYKPGTALNGTWWIAGVSDVASNEVIFLAYDHGVGIATTAPKTLGEELGVWLDRMLAAVGLGRSDARDHHIIEAVIRARRTRTGLAQHGKGLASMIKLVDRSGAGSVSIHSGGGQYLYTRRDGASEPLEGAFALPYRLPGTLITWRLRGPEAATSDV